jgi:16S rRNA G966 N2-methylase RsmD
MNNPDLKKDTFTYKEKNAISHILKNITDSQALNDFLELKSMSCNAISKLPVRSSVGSDFINYHIYSELLNTRSSKNISFYEFLTNIDYFLKKEYIYNLYEQEKKNIENGKHPYLVYKSIFNLHFGSINIFKPWVAVDLYCKFKPSTILDFTSGWGSRMIAAACLNINYIGIDLNKKMSGKYNKMINMIKPYTDSNIQMINADAVSIDYSKLNYDFVFTSPPYYNTEIYTGTKRMSKHEWEQNFYIPVFTETYKYLKKGGYWCINVPQNIYNDICIPLFGNCYKKIELKKNIRNNKDMYKEYIYIWHKK